MSQTPEAAQWARVHLPHDVIDRVLGEDTDYDPDSPELLDAGLNDGCDALEDLAAEGAHRATTAEAATSPEEAPAPESTVPDIHRQIEDLERERGELSQALAEARGMAWELESSAATEDDPVPEGDDERPDIAIPVWPWLRLVAVVVAVVAFGAWTEERIRTIRAAEAEREHDSVLDAIAAQDAARPSTPPVAPAMNSNATPPRTDFGATNTAPPVSSNANANAAGNTNTAPRQEDAAPLRVTEDQLVKAIVSTSQFQPPAPERPGAYGKILMEITLDEEGRVESAKVLSSPDPAFVSEALYRIKLWRFRPFRAEGGYGRPVKVTGPWSFTVTAPRDYNGNRPTTNSNTYGGYYPTNSKKP